MKRKARLGLITLALGTALGVLLPAVTPAAQTAQQGSEEADSQAQKERKKRKKKRAAQKAASETGSGAAEESLSPAVSRAIDQIERRLAAWNTTEAKRLVADLAGAPEDRVALLRGRVAQQEQNWGSAQKELETAANEAPDDATPLLYLGETHLLADNQAAARQAFTRAESVARGRLSERASDPGALYALGVAQQRLMRFDEAYNTLSQARAQAPDDAMVVYQLGVTRAFQERWTDAIGLLDQAIEMNSGIAYAYYYRGLAEGRAGRKDKLINDLNRFLAMAPHSPDAAKARKILESV